MDVDTHFNRLNGTHKDATYFKSLLLDTNNPDNKDTKNHVPNFLTDNKHIKTLTYDSLKCIELQNANGITPEQEAEFLDKLPINSNDCFLVYLNILLKRQQLPITCDKLKHKILNFHTQSDSKNIPDPIQRRINLLIGTSSINSAFEEDDLLVLHLLHSKHVVEDFDLFAINTNYRADLMLDFILYDCEQAKFLQVLLKVFKNKGVIAEKYPELKQLLDNLVLTLKKCKESLIYNPQVLINYWEKK